MLVHEKQRQQRPDLWNTQVDFQFIFTFLQQIQNIRLPQKVMKKVKEEQIKGETLDLWSDLSDYNMWVKTNGHREQAEVIEYEGRSSDKRGRTLKSKSEEI